MDNIERSLTKIKDVDLKIMSELDDRSLLQFCKTNKYANNLCKEPMFWRNRIQTKYPKALEFKSPDRTWRNYYLNIVYYMDKLEKTHKRMYLAAKNGEKDLVDFFISEGADDFSEGMKSAALGGHLELVKYFISKALEEGDGEEWDEYDWNKGLFAADRGRHKDIIDFFRMKGADMVL